MKININQNIPNHILAHGLNDEDHVPGEVQVRPLELLSVTLPLLLTGCTVEIFSLENNIKKRKLKIFQIFFTVQYSTVRCL